MSRMYLSDHAFPAVSNAVMISGSARSGTTIMGKVIHSFTKVEYVFEPPMLFSLFALSNQISEDSWRLLYETYLYEEFMLNALGGRAINCNRNDDSSIYNVKAKDEIDDRLIHSLSKTDAESRAKTHTIAYKIPDVVPYLPELINRYPATRVIVMLRGAVDTLNSLVKKQWFSDKNASSALIWPFRKYAGTNIPFWVREDDDEFWVGLSELDRAAYYYIRANENVEDIKSCIKIQYSNLLQEPDTVAGELAERLNLKFGDKTEHILSQIKPTYPNRDQDIIQRIDAKLRDKVAYYSSLSE